MVTPSLCALYDLVVGLVTHGGAVRFLPLKNEKWFSAYRTARDMLASWLAGM